MRGADRMRRLLSEAADQPSPDGPIVFESHEELEDYVLRALAGLSEAEGDKWIQKAIKKPGRCKDMGGPDCPKGSPQYNLAKRFKPGGDLYKGEAAPPKRKEPEGYSTMGAHMRHQIAWWTKDYPRLRKNMEKWGDLGAQFMRQLDPVHAQMKKLAPWF